MVKPGYKQTEVGVIPEDWEVQLLGKCSSITTGRKDVNEGNPDGEYPFFTCSRNHTYSSIYSFDKEAILIAGNGDVGNLHYYNGKFEAYQRTYVVSDFKVSVQYLWHQLSYRLVDSLGLGKIGSSIPYIKKENLSEFTFPLPKAAEQQAIAAALSDADELIGSLEQLLTKKRRIKQGAMQELLTGKKRLPGYSGEWEVKKLGDIVDFTNGKPLEDHINASGEYCLITLDSIGIDGMLKPEHKSIGILDSSLERNDIVAILSDIAHGNLLGLCDLIPEDNRYVLNQRVARLRVKPHTEADPQFLRLQINRRQHHFKNRGQGTSQRHVYRRDFDEMELSLPLLEEQTAIAEVLSYMDAEIEALETKLTKARQLKQGMMQELLTGRIRLV